MGGQITGAGDPPHGNLTWRDGLLLYKGKVVVPADHSLRAKLLDQGTGGLLQPLPIPAQVWEDITLDFIEEVPTSHGKDTILVVVDRLRVVKLHGMPRSIISDRDPIFISKFCKNSSNSPAPNSCSVQLTIHKQTAKLKLLTAVLNNICAASFTNGRENGVLISLGQSIAYPEGLSPVHEVDQTLLHRDELLHQLKTNLEISMNRMKQQADSKRRDIQFAVGDQVLLKLRPYRQQTVFKRAHQKLSSRYYGPYPFWRKSEQ
ncbi:hypothetical protein CK203_056399 [Vitis vinifera]|uniref:Reverse transcriptase n=1 Tax=Vitis vinifera TaxID=29760 RepID=A0A438GPA4_VITVI|nr:hypothetical protein CK203_056399 [Vitis vinifera]